MQLDTPSVLYLGTDAYVRVPAEFQPDHDEDCGTILDWYPGWVLDDGVEPHVHTAPDARIDECPVCAPLLVAAVKADAADDRFAA